MKHMLRRISLLLIAVILVTGYFRGTGFAHVGADDMPDSVAEVEYRIFLEFKPNNKMVLNKLGMVYYRLGKLDDAEREFAKILKLDHENGDALDGMGLVKAARGEFADAADLHRRAIEINDDDMMAHFHLGRALARQGDLAGAERSYRAALERFVREYPDGTDNQQAAEFERSVRAAIAELEKTK